MPSNQVPGASGEILTTSSPGEPGWLKKGQRLVVWGLVEGGVGVSVQTAGQAEACSTSQNQSQGGQGRVKGQDPIQSRQ